MRFRVTYEQMKSARTVLGNSFRLFYYEDTGNSVFTMVAAGSGFSFFLIHDAGTRPATFATDFPASIPVAGID